MNEYSPPSAPVPPVPAFTASQRTSHDQSRAWGCWLAAVVGLVCFAGLTWDNAVNPARNAWRPRTIFWVQDFLLTISPIMVLAGQMFWTQRRRLALGCVLTVVVVGFLLVQQIFYVEREESQQHHRRIELRLKISIRMDWKGWA